MKRPATREPTPLDTERGYGPAMPGLPPPHAHDGLGDPGSPGQPLHAYLASLQPEPMPDWLRRYRPGDPFPIDEFLAARVVYYPGSGNDGQPVELFGCARTAHSFVYADHAYDQTALRARLTSPTQGFAGYAALALQPTEVCSFPGLLAVLQREPDRDESHGPQRLALLFLQADGLEAYAALFCGPGACQPPFVAVIQDHGFGESRYRFDRNGPLEQRALRSGTLPPWLLVAENSQPWKGYQPVPGVTHSPVERSTHARWLCRR